MILDFQKNVWAKSYDEKKGQRSNFPYSPRELAP